MDRKKIIRNRVCFVAGKSGGHILPCVTLAKQICDKHPDYEIVFFTTDAELDAQLLKNYTHLKYYFTLPFDFTGLTRWYHYPKRIAKFLKSFFISFKQLRKLRPEAVITTGGSVAIPVCLAARLLRIPLELYELNAVPGKTIRFLSPFAYKIWVCFENSKRYLPAQKCTLTSYPLKFSSKTKLLSQPQIRTALKFNEPRPVLLILGGSQGSLFINNSMRVLFETYPDLKNKVYVVHQTGAQDKTDWKAWYATMNITALVFKYDEVIECFYAVADLIICRAGAGTLAEVVFFNKKCITIPLETQSTTHQVDNAYAMTQEHATLFKVVRQQDVELHPKALLDAIMHSLQMSL